MPSPSIDPLLNIGLTELESEAYVFLLKESPATGYRVAQGLGRSVGNVYKSLEALESKGAIVTASEGDNRVYRAVEIDEFLGHVEGEFREAAAKARRSLIQIAESPPDNRVYELANGPQVLERCRTMLRQAKRFALLTLCPAPAEQLADAIEQAASRGVLIGVKVFAPIEIPGVRIIVDPRGLPAVDSGPGQWIFATADGASMLQALLSADGGTLLEAFFTRNPLLTWAAYTGLCSDLMLAAMRPAIERGDSSGEIKQLLAELSRFEVPQSAGKAALTRRYRTSKPSARASGKSAHPAKK